MKTSAAARPVSNAPNGWSRSSGAALKHAPGHCTDADFCAIATVAHIERMAQATVAMLTLELGRIFFQGKPLEQ